MLDETHKASESVKSNRQLTTYIVNPSTLTHTHTHVYVWIHTQTQTKSTIHTHTPETDVVKPKIPGLKNSSKHKQKRLSGKPLLLNIMIIIIMYVCIYVVKWKVLMCCK